ncbi:MAG: hypothetical protein ABIJ24_05920 [Nitrospinota bacterium]
MPKKDNDREHPEELDRLSKAIIEAILSSAKVKQALAELREGSIKLDNSHMVLVLNMKGMSHGGENHIEQPNETTPKKRDFSHQVDGRDLSRNEIQFYEHEANNFDEDGWLKKIKISLEKD